MREFRSFGHTEKVGEAVGGVSPNPESALTWIRKKAGIGRVSA